MATKKKSPVFNKTTFLKKTDLDVLVEAAKDMNESIFQDDPTDIKQAKAGLLESLLQDAEAVNSDDNLKPETWEFLYSIGCLAAFERKEEMEKEAAEDKKPSKPKKAKKAKRFTRIDAAAAAIKEKLDTAEALIDRSSELYVEKDGAENRAESAFYINLIMAGMEAAGAVSVKEGIITYNF